MENIIERIIRLGKLSEDEQGNLIRVMASAPVAGRMAILSGRNKYYANVSCESMNLSVKHFEMLKKYKYAHLQEYDYLCLLLAIEDYQDVARRKRIDGDPLVLALMEGRRNNQIRRCRRQTTLDRIRALYPEIRDLLTKGLTWPEILKYLKRHHRKMFASSKLSASWLRRCYLQVQAECSTKKSPV